MTWWRHFSMLQSVAKVTASVPLSWRLDLYIHYTGLLTVISKLICTLLNSSSIQLPSMLPPSLHTDLLFLVLMQSEPSPSLSPLIWQTISAACPSRVYTLISLTTSATILCAFGSYTRLTQWYASCALRRVDSTLAQLPSRHRHPCCRMSTSEQWSRF